MSLNIPAGIGSISFRLALRRAAVHAGVGISCACLTYFLPYIAAISVLGIVTVAFLFLELIRLQDSGLSRYISVFFSPFAREAERDRLTGAIFLLSGCLITSLLFPRLVAVLAIIFVALGDPVAALIGIRNGKVLFWGKSLEGHFACLAICIISGVLANAIWNSPAIAVTVAGAFFAALFQALPWRLNDNLTMPIGSGLIMLSVNALLLSNLG